LPFLLYRGGVDLTGSSDPEMLIEKIFATNNWGQYVAQSHLLAPSFDDP
jgi:hypothetical protein